MDVRSLDSAVLKAFEYHGKQVRKFVNEPYVVHCLRVASLVADYTEEEDLVIAAVLHDIVENTEASVEDVKEWFGEKISGLVGELSNNKLDMGLVGKRSYMLKKFVLLSNDGLIIKLIDRLDNISGLLNSKAPITFVRRYVNDTDYILENLERELTPIHKVLIGNLEFVNNYVALTTLR